MGIKEVLIDDIQTSALPNPFRGRDFQRLHPEIKGAISYLCTATIEPGRTELTYTRYLTRVKSGFYRMPAEMLGKKNPTS